MNGEQVSIYDVIAAAENGERLPKRRKKRTQADKVIEYINRYGSITQKDANILGVFRLAARVYDINNSMDPKYRGIHIIAEKDKELNQDGEMTEFARYRLG